MAAVDIVPSVGGNYEIRLSNHGSDEATFFLDVEDAPGLTTVLVSASGVTVAAGEVGTWTVNTKGDVDLSGILTQVFSSTYNGQTTTLSVDLNLLEVDGMTWLPPSEDRVLVVPGSSTDGLWFSPPGPPTLRSCQPFRACLPSWMQVSMSKTPS